jgi:hypothetical protein
METPEMLAENEELDTGEEVSTETSSAESPPIDKADFEARVERLCEMMMNDPAVRDRIIAEIYVNIASAEMGIRGIFEAMQSQGIAGLMKGALRRGG